MFSWTDHLGGKMTKSAMATPGFVDGQVSTVKMEGSWNTKYSNGNINNSIWNQRNSMPRHRITTTSLVLYWLGPRYVIVTSLNFTRSARLRLQNAWTFYIYFILLYRYIHLGFSIGKRRVPEVLMIILSVRPASCSATSDSDYSLDASFKLISFSISAWN